MELSTNTEKNCYNIPHFSSLTGVMMKGGKAAMINVDKKVYLITYDLNNPGQRYEDVINAIKKASDGKHFSAWKSSYLIRSNYQTASEVFDFIYPFIDTNDRIIVMEVTGNYAGWLAEWQGDRVNSMFPNKR